MFFIIVVINYWTKINLFSIFVDYQLPFIQNHEKTFFFFFIDLLHLFIK